MVDSASAVAAMSASVSAAELERQYVHEVYESIAPHFSATRHKAWPRIAAFMEAIPPGSLTADVGCGNGKYLPLNTRHSFSVGCDHSSQLVGICRGRGLEALTADNLTLPFRTHAFDFAISIAVIHHFSTPERRRLAVAEVLRILRCGGRALIYVWALEQDSKKFSEPDNFVAWKLQPEYTGQSPAGEGTGSGSGKGKKKKNKNQGDQGSGSGSSDATTSSSTTTTTATTTTATSSTSTPPASTVYQRQDTSQKSATCELA